MQDHDFTSSSHSGEPYYYVFIKGDAPVGKTASRFFRFDTALEAAALYRFLQVEHPDYEISLGIHKDYTRRADIVERIDGVNVLSDSLASTSPWNTDPSAARDTADLVFRLGVTWKVDRELLGRPILIPKERDWSSQPPFLKGKALRPDVPGDPKSSIREASVKGLGWMSLDGLRSHAASCGRGLSQKPPMVGELLVDYQVIGDDGCGSMSITPGDYKLLEKQYLFQQQKRETLQSSQPLDDIKQEARARAQNHLRPASKPVKPLDHAL